MDWLSDPNAWLSLLTLTLLEIVLGVDNIIFISVLSGKLPYEQQGRARTVGLMLALITRVLLLCSIYFLTKMTKPLFVMPVVDHGVSGRDVVLILGGIFLIWKSTHEIHGSLEGENHEVSSRVRASFGAVVTQIILIDIVFSLDSVITAVGMAQHIGVMIAAVVLAMIVMLLAAKSIADFVNQRPTIKMLALSFLLLIGFVLVADGLGQHIPKGYIYFAMAFSFGVELLNLRLRSKQKQNAPIELRKKV